MAKKNVKYYFRGTTLKCPGSQNARTMPYTCTTRNPAKAYAFALNCLSFTNPVIYIAQAVALVSVEQRGQSSLGKWEEEVSFAIKPTEYYKYCDGYITVFEAETILKQMGISLPFIPDTGTLTQCCKLMGMLKNKDIETFVKLAKQYLKTH